MAKYYNIVLEPANIALPRPPRMDRNIESFSESQCWTFFATRKEHLHRLLRCLRFPDRCILENMSVMTGEEVMLRGLYELISGENQNNIAENVFGRDFTQQSRAFKFCIDFLYEMFVDLLTDNLEWWFENGFIEESRRAITQKLAALGLIYGNPHLSQQIALFIDCNCMETSRVAGGPKGEGPDADRWSDLIQRAFYNGWKKRVMANVTQNM
jgi:hypothetical protein